MRFVDPKEREEEILSLIVDSYIKESRPISSAYLCEKCKLNYSSATVRNVMLSLERQGLLSHIYTSSGRVPTKNGFKHYVEQFSEEDFTGSYPGSVDYNVLTDVSLDEVIDYTLTAITQLSGYASLVAISGRNHKIFYKGMRFILEEPEFEDVQRLRDIFYLLEERIDTLQEVLLGSMGDKVRILIGDDIGCEEFSNCSLVISGLREKDINLALSILGPMRMDYVKAASCLHSVTSQLKEVVEEFV